ncbi:hypothetical protein MMC26_005436 [Xylographa opegraphella]|nr:hypothetical protein [Xylographa opegraphella]
MKFHTIGAEQFDSDIFFKSWPHRPVNLFDNNNLQHAIITAFELPHNDSFVYHAVASVTLAQVQQAISHGGEGGLHACSQSLDNLIHRFPKQLPPPPSTDITAYTSIFAPHTVTSKALIGLAANAKKASIRESVAIHLQAQRHLPSNITVSKSKQHINPYYDFWCWSCQNLEWAGPTKDTADVKISHHILPVFMHHFGCIVPSYESLEIIKQIARKRTVIDFGSGNGYWAYMLRRLGVEVQAVDNLQSVWRTQWIGDTIVKNGNQYLQEEKGCKNAVLLLVYPIVGSDFTSKVIDAYQGATICVAGTQNRNGYTAFKDKTIDEYMAAERKDFDKILQIPLPSFAGKDEALFVFEKKEPQEP